MAGRGRPGHRVDDVLAVRPALHQAGGQERAQAHRRAVPLDARRRAPHRRPRRRARTSVRAPLGQQLGRRHRPEPAERLVLDCGWIGEHRNELVAVGDERIRVAEGQRGGGVEVGEVGDLVEDRPTWARASAAPSPWRRATPRPGRAPAARRRDRRRHRVRRPSPTDRTASALAVRARWFGTVRAVSEHIGRPRRVVAGLPAYRPGKGAKQAEAEHGITNAIKLASNENPSQPIEPIVDAVTAAASGAQPLRRPPGHCAARGAGR